METIESSAAIASIFSFLFFVLLCRSFVAIARSELVFVHAWAHGWFSLAVAIAATMLISDYSAGSCRLSFYRNRFDFGSPSVYSSPLRIHVRASAFLDVGTRVCCFIRLASCLANQCCLSYLCKLRLARLVSNMHRALVHLECASFNCASWLSSSSQLQNSELNLSQPC